MKNVLSVLALVALVAFAGCHNKRADQVKTPDGAAVAAQADVVQPAVRKLSVDLHVMSQCPYGVQAENILIPIAEELRDNIDLKIHFVGDEVEAGVPESLHGETEVKADLLQICTGKHQPEFMFGMIICMNQNPDEIPANFDSCAVELKMPVETVRACADGPEGKILLLESFKYSDEKGVKGSPTIFIDGTEYEGLPTVLGLLRGLCEKIGQPAPETCASLPPPVSIQLTVITDSRCPDCAKFVEVAPAQIRKMFPGVETVVLDYMTDEGKEAYKVLAKTPFRFLPAFLFEKKVQEDPAFAQIAAYMMEVGEQLLLNFDASFDPEAEICDNGTDDDGNGKADCKDDSCKGTLFCAVEKPKKLEVFVMSQCPYGAEAILSMREVLEAFGRDIDFSIRFLASEPFAGQFQSLHGPAEVAEDMRQLCAIKYYAKGRKYLDYLYCRAADFQSEEWEKCATGGIRAEVIRKCAEGDMGRKLLSADVAYGEKLRINGSPTWIVNNREVFNGVSPADIQKGFCKKNGTLKACETPLSDKAGVPAGACGN
ncbi:MAG TPA: hypothetical protein PKH54_00010 [Myxococcota bacterium]|nr:hypothetical protein [Myxococcota bacterium]